MLRARFRSDGNGEGEDWLSSVSVAELRRSRDGAYTGRFTIPRDAVFGSFAVETPGGDRVEKDGGRVWELMVHDAGGHPLPQALEQRVRHRGGDARERLAAARELAHLFPDHPAGWALLDQAEESALGYSESLQAAQRSRAAAISARHRPREACRWRSS